ncbi:methyltransferase domain-containing protein [Streptomyces katsurahamanus]|uniref:Protein-L-isoaspartate O-methyltransferase n=1 Tax=Streptomyces katsurahamanus TaxID=2577098 RepID=A0ABW9NYW9_9ACTN|nr:methyltransferase domain-containing protein [Streptomyces katsurahamanus]MQS38476.1 methyltransferase domain-containing protein [Streptomyces katsurahamanus]
MTIDLTDQAAAEARRALAQVLTGSGDLTDPAWRRAFEEVPRHVFVPYFYAHDGERVSGADPATYERWFTAVHEDRSVVTHRTNGAATSSSSQPSLMATMLEALTVTDGMTVLEIGAGTGYNAALLAHRLGETNVTTIDIAPDITGPARERLATVGYRPHVATGDGSLGAPDRAPYDRIIVTCGLTTVPPALLQQLTDDGFLLAPLGNALARIHPTGPGTAVGRFLPHGAFFMPLRHAQGDGVPTRRPLLPTGPARPSTLPAATIADNHFRFLAGIAVPGLTWQYDLNDNNEITGARVWHPDGSIAQLHSDVTVAEAGPRSLWASLEDAHRIFQFAGGPVPDRFGVTITLHEQRVWLDNPDGLSWVPGE